MRSSRWRANSPPVPARSGRSAECRAITLRTHICGSVARPSTRARMTIVETKGGAPGSPSARDRGEPAQKEGRRITHQGRWRRHDLMQDMSFTSLPAGKYQDADGADETHAALP